VKNLNPKLVSIVQSAMSGARLAKFNASVAILNESLAQGAWTPRGSVKASSGFYQGLAGYVNFDKNYSAKNNKAQDEAWDLMMTLSYGRGLGKADVERAIVTLRSGITSRKGEPAKYKPTDDQIKAWVALCEEKSAADELLDAARPLPRVTAIGLSPKVTKTLTECNLDLDLPSIQMAKIEPRQRPAFKWTKKRVPVVPEVMDPYTGKPATKEVNDKLVPAFKNGKRVMETYYIVVWSKGIVHGQSRFWGNGGCEACGKQIPSGKFVPIEAKDKKSGKLISMWLGCDCAANIFGIKDVGIEKGERK
jgi:hypothetical protein